MHCDVHLRPSLIRIKYAVQAKTKRTFTSRSTRQGNRKERTFAKSFEQQTSFVRRAQFEYFAVGNRWLRWSLLWNRMTTVADSWAPVIRSLTEYCRSNVGASRVSVRRESDVFWVARPWWNCSCQNQCEETDARTGVQFMAKGRNVRLVFPNSVIPIRCLDDWVTSEK